VALGWCYLLDALLNSLSFLHFKILLYTFFYLNTTLLFLLFKNDYKFVEDIAGFIIYYLSLVYTFA